MAQSKLFSAGFIFLALIFTVEIRSVEGRHMKFHSKELNTHKRFLARETERVFEGADVQYAPAAPLTPPAAAVFGAAQPPPPSSVHDFRPAASGHSRGIGHYIEAADANVWYPPAAYLDHTAFFDEKKVDPFPPQAPLLNPPHHH